MDGVTSTDLCEHCGAPVPRLALAPPDFEAVVAALRNGSKTLAAAEVKHAAGCEEPEAAAWVAHLLSCLGAWPTAAADAPLLQQIEAAFAAIEKPEHFTNFHHCDECAEHDTTLRNRTRDTLRRQDLGNPGWDPLVFSSVEGIAYFLPALARFALLPDVWRDHEWYGCQILSHLCYEAERNRFLAWCSERQREAVYGLLKHLEATRGPDVQRLGCNEDLAAALSLWRTPD